MSYFITDAGASVNVWSSLSRFSEDLSETRHSYVRRIVRNWTIYISHQTIVVYNAYETRAAFLSRDMEVSRLNDLIDELPLSIKRCVRPFVESYWNVALEAPIHRDNAGLSDRTFGIELEFCFPNTWTRESLCRHMADMGLNIHWCGGYSHEVRSDWKMTTDASVSSERPGFNTCEISSPILKGREGLLNINKVCQILDDCGCVVNKTCGFHVHHGARDLTESRRLDVLQFYRLNEGIIDMLVSQSRRGGNNRYCRSLTSYPSTRFPSDRYVKVNACAYSKYGTLEFRQHQGTINYQKIANWIKLTQRIMEVTHDKVKRYSSLEQMIHALDLDICLDFFNSRVRELAR